ncbi:phosphatase PAP2 family protein [Nakamurella sp. YIM 132087]|uniref:Phosphatase PAP2 family protein n=1 Tax=Nakamurella alba TaxID=2665158 RepID=A0A7K1FQ41_9ACTN|nr:phosphatase PAP2 family protein [Nakamurella alba]MTD14924.1 phosphatase PAP2 family protein [Nakamurella alba]
MALPSLLRSVADRVDALDKEVVRRVGATGHLRYDPVIDALLPVTRIADNSVVWILSAAGMVAFGDPVVRRRALQGLGTIAVTSLVVNQGLKRLFSRPRPDQQVVPEDRRAAAKSSSSFPSGHTASAVAFVTVTGRSHPLLTTPLAVVAVAVGSSRVATGMHYPSDVLVGGAVGAVIGRIACRVLP